MFRTIAVVMCCAAVAMFAGCSAGTPVPNTMREGQLGHPLGRYLTVEGTMETRGKVGTSTLLVDTVDGRRLDAPVAIWVDNAELHEGRVVLKGYESGRYIGVPPEVARATGRHPQAAWQFQRYFIATSAESGATLR